MKLPEKFLPRVIMTVIGILICSLAVSMFKASLFGVDPFQCLAQGSHARFFTMISFGTFYALLNLILLIVDFFLDKHYIGIATFLNLFLLGYVVDFFFGLITTAFPAPTLAIRAVLLVVGVVLLCFASSLYMTSDLGVSTYDAIPIVISNRTKAPFKFCRIGCDLICVLVGFACGLMPGLGTLITAFFMGPLVDFFNRHFSRPVLYGKERAAEMNRAA